MTALPDHLVVAFLLLVAPAWGAWEYRKFVREARAGKERARVNNFRWTIVNEWVFVLLLLVWWMLAGRSLSALGFVLPPGIRTVAGLVLTALGLLLLALQWRAMLRLDERGLDSLKAQAAAVIDMLPRTAQEHRWFKAVSVTAGICEELVFRGFMTWYLAHWMSPWLAAVVAAVAFGAAHFYQGLAGVVKTGVTGLIMGLLFVGSGSVLWPMILHAAVDLQGGAAGRRLLAWVESTGNSELQAVSSEQ
jgi:membrane protease YdiL (CAAX protease family)